MTAAGAAALAGVRILEVSEGIAAPYACSLLGDMGADVIKVERPDGDWGRTAGRSFGDGVSAVFLAMNRNKRNLGLDLKRPGALDVLHRLIPDCHVLVSNFRPGVMDRLGLGHDACTQLRPDLVYCTISAFDTQGPYADRPGNDTGMQAVSGFMSLNGEPGGEPLRAGIPVVDMTAALFCVQAVLGALRLAADDPGRRVELSLLNSAAALETIAFAEYLNGGELPARSGNQNPFIAPAGAFAGSDGRYFTVACLRQSHWENLCTVIGRAAMAGDGRFADNDLRVANRSALNAVLDEVFAARPAAEWLAELGERNVLCQPVNDLREVERDAGLGPTLPVAGVGDGARPLRTITNPIRFGGAFPETREGPAARGAHTVQLLREHGFADAEIASLTADRAVFAPATVTA